MSVVVAAQAAERVLVEDRRDQAEVALDGHLAGIAHRDAGALLAAVLEGVEGVEGQALHLAARRDHAEDAALLAGRVVQAVGLAVAHASASGSPRS